VLAHVPGALSLADFVLGVLDAEFGVRPAPPQHLLLAAARTGDVEAHLAGRFFGSLGDLAFAGNAWRRAADRLLEGGTFQTLVAQEGRRALALNVTIELGQLVVDDIIRRFLAVVASSLAAEAPDDLLVAEDLGVSGVVAVLFAVPRRQSQQCRHVTDH